ncbi:MAG: hypothetical protein ACRD20_02425 [Terriglobales bacterium]
MSNLTQQECSAGISRKALQTVLSSTNGKKGNHDRVLPVHPGQQKATKVAIPTEDSPGVRNAPPIPERTSVIETWNSNLDILNVNGWNFVIRETVHVADRPQGTYLYLSRIELEVLGRKINQVLAETPSRSEA